MLHKTVVLLLICLSVCFSRIHLGRDTVKTETIIMTNKSYGLSDTILVIRGDTVYYILGEDVNSTPLLHGETHRYDSTDQIFNQPGDLDTTSDVKFDSLELTGKFIQDAYGSGRYTIDSGVVRQIVGGQVSAVGRVFKTNGVVYELHDTIGLSDCPTCGLQYNWVIGQYGNQPPSTSHPDETKYYIRSCGTPTYNGGGEFVFDHWGVLDVRNYYGDTLRLSSFSGVTYVSRTGDTAYSIGEDSLWHHGNIFTDGGNYKGSDYAVDDSDCVPLMQLMDSIGVYVPDSVRACSISDSTKKNANMVAVSKIVATNYNGDPDTTEIYHDTATRITKFPGYVELTGETYLQRGIVSDSSNKLLFISAGGYPDRDSGAAIELYGENTPYGGIVKVMPGASGEIYLNGGSFSISKNDTSLLADSIVYNLTFAETSTDRFGIRMTTDDGLTGAYGTLQLFDEFSRGIYCYGDTVETIADVLLGDSTLFKCEMVRQAGTWHAFGGFHDSSVTVSISVQNDWYQITNGSGTLFSGDEADGITLSGDTMTFENAGDYNGSLSITFSGVAGQDYSFRIYNVTQTTQSGYDIGQSTTGAGNQVNVSFPLYIEAIANDEFVLQVSNESGTQDPVLKSSVFRISYLHD